MERKQQGINIQRQIVEQVKEVRRKHKRMGGRKLYNRLNNSLKALTIKCGRDKFFEILRCEDLLVRYRKRYVKTTQSKYNFYKYPNLIQELEINRAEQVL